jgi:perosamine synthetase
LSRPILPPEFRVSVGCVDVASEEHRQIAEVLASKWVSPGPKVEAFEKKFAELHDCSSGVMVNSGTDALRIALAALKEIHGWADGDEVIVPALTFVATVNIILQNGLKPVFVDINPRDFNINHELIKAARTSRTRAIIPVHMFGLMADMYQVEYESQGLKIIEDSCETVGTRFAGAPEGNVGYGRDKSVGSFGDISCFSTYACHLIVTGVGGIAITNNSQYEEIMRSYANHGRDPYFLGGYSKADDPIKLIEKRFQYHRVGYSSRVSEFEAAMGLAQLERIDKVIRSRQKNAQHLSVLLSEVGEIVQIPYCPVNRSHAYMMYPLVLKEPAIDRDEFCLRLEELGVETRPLMPLLTQPVYTKMWGDLYQQYPAALEATSRGFYVGCHQQLTIDDLGYLGESISEVAKTLYARKYVPV